MNSILNSATPARGHVIRQDSHYAWYVVFLLLFVYTVAFIDRQVLNLLVDPIKLDLMLSDVDISFLQGFAFMFAYIVCGPVFGRWADTGHRRNILIFGVTMWSICTVLCGMADSFWELFLARAGVGAAEASLAPVAWSMIADYFTKPRLPRAMSIFLMGPSLGAGLALVAGGLVIAFAGELIELIPIFSSMSTWQVTFMMVGFPGLLLALLLLTVREPVRTSFSSEPTAEDRAFTVPEIAQYIWKDRAFFLRVFFGMGMLAIVIYGLPTWMPSYLIRHFDANPATVGLQYGVLVLTCGALGIILGPTFGRLLQRMGYQDSALRSAAICCGMSMVGCALLPFATSYGMTLAISAVITFFYALPQAMVASSLQFASPNRLRGVISTLYLFMISVCGLGLAPSLIAFVTDYVLGGPEHVGTSLSIVCTISAAVAFWLYARALKPYRAKLAQLEQDN
jgi:MFS family permease